MANSMQGGFLRDDTGALVLSAGSGSGSVAPGLTLAGLGDSKTANGSVSTTNAATSAQTLLFGALDVRNWHLWACLLSNGALTYASGGWAAGLNGDNVHPNGKGAKAMGQAVATALQTWTTPGPPFLPTVPADTASGRYNGLGNPLFTDTNADGTPDGWTLSGAPTAASAADAAVVGNAFSITRTAADGFASGPNTIPTSQGDVLQVSTRIKSTVEASGGNIYFAVIDASSEAALGFQLQGWNVDIPWSTLSVAFKAPAMGAATAMKMKNSARGVAGAQLQIAQVALVNLTTAGLA
jgi:hypothetical protein